MKVFTNRLTIFAALFLLFICKVQAEPRPLIGITPSISSNSIQLNCDYVAAINENGGIAIILPPTDDESIIAHYVSMLDGAVFSGGPDIPPDFYGQNPHPTTQVMEPKRANFEKVFIKNFLESGKPAFGICLGMQFSNVVSGGSMIQDIPTFYGSRISHRNGEMYTNFHHVGLAKGSRLAEILGSNSAAVISRHHQALDKIAEAFQVVARSPDGVVEAVERRDGIFGLFVQWHPESMKNADQNHRNLLFKAMVDACLMVKQSGNLNQ